MPNAIGKKSAGLTVISCFYQADAVTNSETDNRSVSIKYGLIR